MLEVAEYLSEKAKNMDPEKGDIYARTAFNRYYYAAFLSIRELLNEVNPDWVKSGHENVPIILTVSLIKEIKKSSEKLLKCKILESNRKAHLIAHARAASQRASDLLKIAYNVRVSADYFPEELVVFNGKNFSLNSHSQEEAEKWKSNVDIQKGILYKILKELAIV